MVLFQIGDQRRLVEEPRAFLWLAAGQDSSMLACARHQIRHMLHLGVGVVDGPEEDVRVGGVISGLGVPHRFGHRREEFVVGTVSDHHAGRRGAVLPGIEIACGRQPFDCCLNVSIIEDDHRRLAAEFQVGAFHVLCGAGRDGHSRPGGPRDGNHLRYRVGDEVGAGVIVGQRETRGAVEVDLDRVDVAQRVSRPRQRVAEPPLDVCDGRGPECAQPPAQQFGACHLETLGPPRPTNKRRNGRSGRKVSA